MNIRVEFYGIPRQRAGIAVVSVKLDGEHSRVVDVLNDLAQRFPKLAAECFDNGRLAPGCSANLDGAQFVVETDMRLVDGQSLLIMSSDAGG